MKRVRAFKNIWSIAKKMYFGLRSFRVSASFTFLSAVIIGLLFMVTLGKYIPLPPLFHKELVLYIIIPFGFAWFVDEKTVNDKNPFSFFKTMIAYGFRHKQTVMGRDVYLRKIRTERERITTVTDIRVAECKKKGGIKKCQNKENKDKSDTLITT